VKAVILAGGRGSRIAEESVVRPKPLVEIGGRPIIWHIMKLYEHFGVSEFVICAGYKGYLLKDYFANLALHNSDVTFDMSDGSVEYHGDAPSSWRVTVADTGIDTMTAGRVRRVAEYLDDDAPFFLTYGDGVADVDIEGVLALHRREQRLVTMTAVRPPARFGTLDLDGAHVRAIFEKLPAHAGLVNGGFFVCERSLVDEIAGDDAVWETDVLRPLAERGQLAAYVHDGFWQPMDTVFEREQLEQLWAAGTAPWKVW
jgi:glucose-1-phosphate cytidylyltransferase